MKNVTAIEISFAVGVELTNEDQKMLGEVIGAICARYEKEHSDRVMWPFGMGSKMLTNPFMADDDHPMWFDNAVFTIEVTERANYDHPCAKCGLPQGDHKGHILNPKAGKCSFDAGRAALAEKEE